MMGSYSLLWIENSDSRARMKESKARVHIICTMQLVRKSLCIFGMVPGVEHNIYWVTIVYKKFFMGYVNVNGFPRMSIPSMSFVFSATISDDIDESSSVFINMQL